MNIAEVYPNPTVKEVVFQIIFPNLFFLENKIGDIQLAIMSKFPISNLLYRRQVVFADIGQDVTLTDMQKDLDTEKGHKIWQFKSSEGYQLNILNNSLDISSKHHKTYNNEGGDKFRDIIDFAISNFIRITNIPTINRIGLRYIDECPIPKKSNTTFKRYYNTALPLSRFDISLSDEMSFSTITKINNYKLRYSESIVETNDGPKLILDFDGFSENINSSEFLSTTDDLHSIISNEYNKTIKDPVITYMRKAK